MTERIYRSFPTQPLIQSNFKKTAVHKGESFSHELKAALRTDSEGITVSKHAKVRLEQRGIAINDDKWKKIGEKVMEAQKLGVKESLVLLADAALIVSAKNNTVITAMNRAEASSQIFTNINGAILID